MAIYIRGANPIWSLVDLTGKQLDDTYYMFVLENTLPYIPATVWHDLTGATPWTQPIQFNANGTLPVDIFWDPDKVYRLEIRQGNTQNDPLIYLVENYSPGSANATPVDVVSLSTNNQITNPQFALINFASPMVMTGVTNPDPYEVAPGWFLNLTGTGNVTVSRLSLNSTLANVTNAPYALEIVLSGTWTQAYLSQRFEQNGMLWANKYVSSSITARIEGAPQAISAALYDSLGNALQSVLDSTVIDDTFNEYQGTGLLPATVNTDTPPAAYIEYRLSLPTAVDIFVTSFQLIASDTAIEVKYEQDTIDRQIDYTFHYYQDSLVHQQKQSVLTGWDFSLNPWQSYPITTTNLATFGYTADQTIVLQQAYIASSAMNNISTERGTAAQNYGFKVTAVTGTNQFALVQYIAPQTIRGGWGALFSSLVKLTAQLQNPLLSFKVKMRLIYKAGLPSTISQTEPIASWGAGNDPTFAGGWTALKPMNDPAYSLVNGANTLAFEGFQLPASSNDNMTLGIVIYTVSNMDQTPTADNLIFNKVSLVQNDFAIDTPSLTWDETLKRCQAYYETSFDPYGATLTTGPQRSSIVDAVYAPMNAYFNAGAANMSCVPNGYGLQYKSIKIISPTLSFYSGASTTLGNILAFLNASSGTGQMEQAQSTYFTSFGGNGVQGFSYRGTGLSTMVPVISSSSAGSAGILYHYIANARLGQ